LVTPVFFGNFGEVADPRAAPGLVEFLHAVGRFAADPAIARMVDEEIELRPILGRLADIADIGIGPQMRELLFGGGREQTLMDADVLDPRFHRLFIERVHQLLVIGVPGMVRLLLVGVVADRVALP